MKRERNEYTESKTYQTETEKTAKAASHCAAKFHYDVADPAEEDAFWDKAIEAAHANRLQNQEQKSDLTLIETILIREKPDPYFPDDPECTVLYISKDTENQFCYSLEELFLSHWDGLPTYRGGPISSAQFKQYMKRINNHQYD